MDIQQTLTILYWKSRTKLYVFLDFLNRSRDTYRISNKIWGKFLFYWISKPIVVNWISNCHSINFLDFQMILCWFHWTSIHHTNYALDIREQMQTFLLEIQTTFRNKTPEINGPPLPPSPVRILNAIAQ